MNKQLPISRRKIMKLASAGALWLANPLVLPRAHAQGIPKRFYVFCKPGGMYFSSWIKQGASGLEYGSAVQSLAPFKDKTMVVANMFNNVARDKHHHMRGMSTMLTGVDPVGSDTSPAGGKSLDQFIADKIKLDGSLRSLEIGLKPAGKVNGETRMVYDGPGAARVVEGNPAKVFDRVFSDLKTTGGAGASSVLDRRQRVLDRVNRHVKLLSNELVGEDKIKLDKHLATVETLEARLLKAIESSGGACAVGNPSAGLSVPEEADLLMDLAAQAFICGATNVGSFMISQGAGKLKYEWLPETAPYTKGMNWHGITHQLPRNTNEAKAWYVAADKWELDLLARFLKQLDETPEDGGTMLDHSVVLLCGEIRNPNGHAHKGMTWALFGGNATTNWKYNSWVKADSNLHQLHTSIGRAFGLPWDKFGKVNGHLAKIEA